MLRSHNRGALATRRNLLRVRRAAYDLGDARPVADGDRAGQRRLAERELDLLERAILEARPDHVFHMYGDPVIRGIIRRPLSGASMSILVFRPRAHTREFYGTRLTPREYVRARALEHFVTTWRARADAHSIWTLDEAAAYRWRLGQGARSVWLPEPYVQGAPDPVMQRTGVLLYGALAPRKGIDRLAAAVETGWVKEPVILAGPIESGFEPAFETLVTGCTPPAPASTYARGYTLRRMR